MRCRECDYPLWNLKDKHCPECGESFQVSEYEFVPNSMRFGCPYCDQCYFGTGVTGHLEPVEFDCVKCGQHIHMDDMTVAPAEGVTEAETIVDNMPWLERKKTGLIKGWFLTVVRSLFNPVRLAKTIPRDSLLSTASMYFSNTQVMFILISALPLALIMVPMFIYSGAGFGAGSGITMLFPIIGFAFVLLAYIIVISVLLLLWYLSVIFVFSITGKVIPKSNRRVYQVMCYSSGANVLIAIPCLGLYLSFISWIWWAASAMLMLREITKYSYKRIISALLLFPVLFTAGMITLRVMSFSIMASQLGTINNMPYNYYMVQTDTDSIIAGLHNYSKANSGAAPEHAIQLVTSDYITENTLCAVELYSTNNVAYPVPVAGRTLEQVMDINLEEDQRDIYVQFAIDDLPEDVIAHRLGDYIFTYHGIDLANPPDQSLWVVVMYPDSTHTNTMNTGYIAGTVNYSTEYIDSDDFKARLDEQNQIRLDCGLAPLPDLSTITNDSPASGGDQ